MSNSAFIEGLVATAQPVVRRRVSVELLALVAVAVIQIVGASYFFGDDAWQKTSMFDGARVVFKVSFLGVAAVAFAALCLWSLDPATRRMGSALAGVVGLAALVGFVGFEWQVGSSFASTLYPQFGLRCFFSILFLALPVTLLLSLFMVRGASTQPNQTAILVGLAGGTWGAFTYALQCPFVSIYYLGVWYVGGIALVALVARVLLPRLARW
ncbi:MAG: NrsF family protein [Pseudomonadota bacterium]